MTVRRALVVAAILLAVFIAIGLAPVFSRGLHQGFNPSTDNGCMSRLAIQFCGHTTPAPSPAAIAPTPDAITPTPDANCDPAYVDANGNCNP